MEQTKNQVWGLAPRGVLGAIVVIGVVMAGVSVGISQDKGEKSAAKPQEPGMPSQEQMAEMMKQWQAIAAPGEHHKKLESFVGKWDLAVKMWHGGADAPPEESRGVSEIKWILGGRFIEEKIKSEFTMPDEKGEMKKVPFEGQGLSGYDNYRNLYVGTWADNMGTQLLCSKGTCDPTGKVFTSYMEMDEPLLKVYGRMVKVVGRILDKDKHVMEMYDLHAGENYKVMEITYTRSK